MSVANVTAATPPTVRIARRFTFSASHRYWVPAWSEAENERRFGIDVRPHGHNFVVEAVVEGPLDATTGMIENLNVLKADLGAYIDAHYDHRHLNTDHPAYHDRLPTPEHMALSLYGELGTCVRAPARLVRLRLWDSEDTYAEVAA